MSLKEHLWKDSSYWVDVCEELQPRAGHAGLQSCCCEERPLKRTGLHFTALSAPCQLRQMLKFVCWETTHQHRVSLSSFSLHLVEYFVSSRDLSQHNSPIMRTRQLISIPTGALIDLFILHFILFPFKIFNITFIIYHFISLIFMKHFWRGASVLIVSNSKITIFSRN